MRAVADRHCPGPGLRSLLERAIEVGERQGAVDRLVAVELPLEVHESVTGEWHAGTPLAAACGFVYLGADVLDNVADDELPAEWADCSASAANLAGATMLASLSHLALAECATAPERRHRLHTRLAEGLASMALGQATDIAPPDDSDLVDVALETVAAKSGAEFAMVAELAAFGACGEEECVAAFGAYGRSLGIAGQLSSDCHDIWRERPSRDLLNGRRTLPVAFAHAAPDSPEREVLLERLDAARTVSDLHGEVADRLAAMGALHYVAIKVEVELGRAAAALEPAAAHSHTVGPLRRRLREFSMLSPV
jgi:geranylgeranyl pyrophosphate synthase